MSIECAKCGLAPCDLPDGIDPEGVFEQIGGDWYCQADANGASFTLTVLDGDR
jgi:hypothetical protein